MGNSMKTPQRAVSLAVIRRCAWVLCAAPALAMAGMVAPQCDVTLDIVGTGVGAIPDGTAGGAACGDPGAPRLVTFALAATPGFAVADLSVSLELTHSWMGDLTATLIAPDARSHTLFGRVGALSAGSCGENSNFGGTYVFSDFASPPNGGLWQAATAAGADSIVPSGSYRTTNSGGLGAVNPMPATSMLETFGGMPAASGNWTLYLTDGGEGDNGNVAAATLTLCLAMLTDEIFADGFESLPF